MQHDDVDDVWPSATLRVNHLSITIGQRKILSDFSFEVPKHGLTAIIGPSGCGKSTLLKALVHLIDRPDVQYEGSATYGSVDLLNFPNDRLGTLRRHIAYIHQSPAAFPGSVLDNVILPLRYWLPRARDLRERAERALRSVRLWDELSGRLGDDASELSSGQLQRLSVARALVIESPVLLLDEPCASVDPIATTSIEALLWEIKYQRSVLIVTHNMQQAARISDRTLFVMLGRLVEFADTNTMFMNPREKLTEDYVTGRFG